MIPPVLRAMKATIQYGHHVDKFVTWQIYNTYQYTSVTHFWAQ